MQYFIILFLGVTFGFAGTVDIVVGISYVEVEVNGESYKIERT